MGNFILHNYSTGKKAGFDLELTEINPSLLGLDLLLSHFFYRNEISFQV